MKIICFFEAPNVCKIAKYFFLLITVKYKTIPNKKHAVMIANELKHIKIHSICWNFSSIVVDNELFANLNWYRGYLFLNLLVLFYFLPVKKLSVLFLFDKAL